MRFGRWLRCAWEPAACAGYLDPGGRDDYRDWLRRQREAALAEAEAIRRRVREDRPLLPDDGRGR